MDAKDFLGKRMTLGGYLFSVKKELIEAKYDVINSKQVPYVAIDLDTLKEVNYYAVSLLVKRKEMKRAKWTRAIPLRKLPNN